MTTNVRATDDSGDEHLVIRLHPPSRDIRLERLPKPRIQHPDDAIVRITLAGLCGSDMHSYRGHAPVTEPFVMGHEFIGQVVDLGSSFAHAPNGGPTSGAESRPELYRSLKIGDRVVSPFSTSCDECKFCRLGFTSRCEHSLLFGHPLLPGAQAQYVRVPKAGGTLFKIPPGITETRDTAAVQDNNTRDGKHEEEERVTNILDLNDKRWAEIDEGSFLRLADVLPTGCFGALQALTHTNLGPILTGLSFPYHARTPVIPQPFANFGLVKDQTLTIAVIGLGPVGVCATVAVFDYLRDHPATVNVVCIDLMADRRQSLDLIIQRMGVISPTRTFAVADPTEGAKIVNTITQGLGCDAVVEAVGINNALTLAYDLIRPFGVISSIGVHNNTSFPLGGPMLYNKNVALCFGRCPVRSMFPHAVDLLLRRRETFRAVGQVGMGITSADRVVAMSNEEEVKKAYDEFDKWVDGKVLFDPWR